MTSAVIGFLLILTILCNHVSPALSSHGDADDADIDDDNDDDGDCDDKGDDGDADDD